MLQYKSILCALDFDDQSIAALAVAAELARTSGATLHVLHVARIPAQDMDVPLPIDTNPRWERDARSRVETVVRQHVPKDSRCEVHVMSGLPDMDIAREAARLGVDLIVVGTHGRSGLSHLVLGSVAESVMREATCSVLVVRPPKLGRAGASIRSGS